MTIAISPFTMPAALAAADHFLGEGAVWHGNPENVDQEEWLRTFRTRAQRAQRMPEIKSNATQEVDQHIRWLSAQGWNAQITQGQPGDLFLASVLNVVSKWHTSGQAIKEGSIDRVFMKKGAFASSSRVNPVVELMTQNTDIIWYFQQVDIAPRTRNELMDHASRMVFADMDGARINFDFPMIDACYRDDAKYMLGLRCGNNVVTQAAEQFRLQMNHIGGRAAAAAEVAVSRGMDMTRTVKITGPFVVAVHIASSASPPAAFAMYCDRDTWKRPDDSFIG